MHMATATDILKAAQGAPAKDSLEAHLETIETLRDKGYTWREIAAFLTERGVPTDDHQFMRYRVQRQRAA